MPYYIKKKYAYTEGSLAGLTYTETPYGYATDVDDPLTMEYADVWNDRLTSYNGQAITYDAIGNPLTYGYYTYSWQNGRQLASVYSFQMMTNSTYQYNDEGIRTEKVVNGIKHEYSVSGGQINREVIYSANGQYVTKDLRYYYDAAGNPTAIRAFTRTNSTAAFTSNIYYLLTDMQGDVIAIYNQNGERIFEYVYDAWGNILRSVQKGTGGSAASAVNPFRYRGYYYDTDTGLYYLQSRYYNPQWGRFLNADSYVNANGDLQGFNMFAYCSNNPIMNIDPSGEGAVLDWFADKMKAVSNWIDKYIMQGIKQFSKNMANDIINYDKNNTDESKVFSSNYFSCYKGKFVIKTSFDASFSFGIIGLSKSQQNSNTLNHEYGHTIQLEKAGILNYINDVAIPSVTANLLDRMGKLPYDYYGSPWEAEADYYGGVHRTRNNTPWPSGSYGSYKDLLLLFF